MSTVPRIAAPGAAVSSGRRGRGPLPDPTADTWPDMGPDFVMRVVPWALCCPACRTPFEDDGDRYFTAACFACDWKRPTEHSRTLEVHS